ncbi:MAG: ABC transporter permease [Lachnospiraceae bacterium]
MFYLQKAILNIKRYRIKSLLVVLICSLIITFLFLYLGGLRANQAQKLSLPDAVPVYARISNLNGTLNTGLLIKESVVDALEHSPYVTDFRYTVELGAAVGPIIKDEVPDMEPGRMNFPLCLGLNHISSFPELDTNKISYGDGFDSNIFEGDEPLFILRERELEEMELSIGDRIPLTLFYVTYPNDNSAKDFQWLDIQEVTIAGSFNDSLMEDSQRTVQVLFPVKWLQQIHQQANVMFFADSVSFRVATPLDLNGFKAQAKQLRFMSVISQAQPSQRGIALIINDETFIKSATHLLENIELMLLFMPLLIIIVGLVGFILSYLLLQNRKPEFAIMRSMGLSQGSCFLLLFLENAILQATGSMLGITVSTLFINLNAETAAVVLLFFVVYMTGTSAALILLGRFSVMQVLTALD